MSDGSEDELDMGRRDFGKLVSIHNNEGFKEGISNGRESQYQHGFDLGFTDGLKSGFSIGQLMAFKELHPNSDLPDIELACESCKSGPYFPLDETSRRNREAQQNVLNTLQSAINKTQE